MENCIFHNLHCSEGDNGGCIYLKLKDNYKAKILSCTFSSCSSPGGGNYNHGGAVCADEEWRTGDSLLIRNCSFTDCAIGDGGAVAFRGSSSLLFLFLSSSSSSSFFFCLNMFI
jgi:hypothetical protein